MNIEQKLSGSFEIEVSGGRRGTIRQNFGNLITDQGIQRLLDEDGLYHRYGFIALGSGTSPPSPSDKSLEIPEIVRGSSNMLSGKTRGYDAAGGYSYTRNEVFWGRGEASGTFREISAADRLGAGSQQTDSAFSRALITDSSGSPTDLVVLPDESLRVTYELRSFWVTPPPVQLSYEMNGVQHTTVASFVPPTPSELAACGAPNTGRLELQEGSSTIPTEHDPASSSSKNISVDFPINLGVPEISGLSQSTNPYLRFIPSSEFLTFSPPIVKNDTTLLSIKLNISMSRA